MPIIYDPINQNAASGTELMMRALEKNIDSALLDKFAIGRAIMLFKDSALKKIYWTHNLPGQLNVREVSEFFALKKENRWNFLDRIVFVSEWQRSQYISKYNFAQEDIDRTSLLRNAIVPIPSHSKPRGTIRLIYMSVPERGLDVLYEVFNRIYKKYDIELLVFSSYKIYGIPQCDVLHRRVLEDCKRHPKIRYFGSVDNSVIRQALEQSHIFAYPSTFLETSCVSLIEAMSARCLCVHPDLAALPETAAGFTDTYEFNRNKSQHMDIFQESLERTISQYQENNTAHLDAQKDYIDRNYSWDNRIQEWRKLLTDIIDQN
jgi:UDP-glucose:(glucosyl)LPS alpha-1,2-glucosyltransferase